jgi:hypothetical protein
MSMSSPSPLLRPYDRDQLRHEFQSAQPFPHIKMDNFLQPEVAQEIAAAYPTFDNALSMGFQFNALNEQRKVQVTQAGKFPGPVARLNEALSSPAFLKDLEYITGIPDLLADARLAGGGMHLTGPGGRLDVHVDFNFDENIKLHRRLNILVYLNPVWEPTWGGEIELWDKDVKHRGVSLLPVLNRCLIFRTDETSYHGVRPITGPAHVERKSFAAYYYTKEPPPGWSGQIHSTVFKARPDEKLRGYVLMPVQRIREEVRQGLRRVKNRVKRMLIGVGPE